MNKLSKYDTPASAFLAGAAILAMAVASGAVAQVAAPTLTPASLS